MRRLGTLFPAAACSAWDTALAEPPRRSWLGVVTTIGIRVAAQATWLVNTFINLPTISSLWVNYRS
jgi:hypothetical protein